MSKPKVYIETYGCSANLQDAQIMMGILRANGFEIVNDPNDSDINLINTCVVKTPTEQRMVHRIRELTKLRKPLITAGCMAKTEPDVVERLNPSASLIGPDALGKVAEVAKAALEGRRMIALEDLKQEKPSLPHIRLNPVIDIVEISSGCLSSCSFCQTKLARGWLYSYRPNSIRQQIENAVMQGCKEIWLTSQDSSAYGRDLGTNLAELLSSICSQVEGRYWIRVGMMNPLHFQKVEISQLIKSYESEKVFKFLHLCVQSGSDKVLRDMRRGYSVEDFIYYVNKFRESFPELNLVTDIIVGFPTEEEEDFELTVKLMERVGFDAVNISKYGARPGTYAAKAWRPLSADVVNRRSRTLTELAKEQALRRNERWLGWMGEAIVDEVGKRGEAIARNYAYKPIVLKDEDGKSLLGKFVEVEVQEAKPYCLIGDLRSIND